MKKKLRFAGFLGGQSPHGLTRVWPTWASPACLETRLSKDPPSQMSSETVRLLSLHVEKTCAPESRGPPRRPSLTVPLLPVPWRHGASKLSLRNPVYYLPRPFCVLGIQTGAQQDPLVLICLGMCKDGSGQGRSSVAGGRTHPEMSLLTGLVVDAGCQLGPQLGLSPEYIHTGSLCGWGYLRAWTLHVATVFVC